MASEVTIGGYIGIAGTGVLMLGFAVPPLTLERDFFTARQEVSPLAATEYAYCVAERPYLDCHCFASTSAHVQNVPRDRAEGFYYPDPVQLARRQAESRCG